MGALHPEQLPAQADAVVVCQATGVTIPECSCPRCVGELIRRHAPALPASALPRPETPRAA